MSEDYHSSWQNAISLFSIEHHVNQANKFSSRHSVTPDGESINKHLCLILIVTRWKTHPEGGIMHDKISSRPILQFVAIQRRDTSEWALPGGKNMYR